MEMEKLDVRNPEHYMDLTAHDGILRAEKSKYGFRPLVYICSPYAGDVETNTEKAKRYCRFAIAKNRIPFAPHLLYPQFLSEQSGRGLALYMGLVMLTKCDELWVFGEKVTQGMALEIRKAQRRGMAMRYVEEEEVDETDDIYG